MDNLNPIAEAISNDWNNGEEKPVTELPSRFQINDRVKVFLMPEGENNFPGIRARVRAVHFTISKVKYDVELEFEGGFTSRVYNVDSVIVDSI